jgi:signal transduction histidine kinase
MRFIPRSLAARLFLILLFGLLLAQMIAGYMIFKDRGEAMRTSREDSLSQRIVMTVKTFDVVSVSEYPALLETFNQPGFSISLTEQPIYKQQQKDNFFLHHIRRVLNRHLGKDRPLHLTPPFDWDEHHKEDHKHSFRRFKMPLMLSTTIKDGRWININTTLNHRESWGSNLLASILLVMAAIALVAFIAVRGVIRPLTTLANAADQFGHNRELKPLAEKGPKEVVESVRAFNRMQQQISTYLKEREEMLAAVSHDLRTPLTRMKLRLEMQEDQKLLESMNADIDEMETMISSTLDYMRGIANDEPVVQVSMDQLLQEISANFQLKGGSVSLHSIDPVSIAARPVALKRCISNIVDNGLKYGNHVDIELKDDQKKVIVCIRDQGPGIPDDQLESVFSPFTRVDKSRNRTTGGTGLGLGIARTIARNNGGDITISNRSEGGLEVIIALSKKSG